MDKKFMQLAIEEAKKSSEKLKCGAVIVLGEQVIAKSYNSQRNGNDATAHAEINAIREAGKRQGNKNLDNCIIYCTCEPCIMCLTAIAFAKLRKIVYGVSLKDVTANENLIKIDTETFLAKAPYNIEIVRDFMKEECGRLL